jgi:deazaflavin-dependent oxidoreductase (nitroreductase family)
MVAAAPRPYGHPVTPRRLVFVVEWAVHRGFHRLTGHRFSTQAPTDGKVGTLFLVSKGRRSGKERRNGLFYIVDGENLVVVASNAGENVDPQWWKNLQATPDAEVELGTHRQPIRARRATDEERQRLWPQFDAGHPEFAEYRERAYRRTIPIVIFEPREPAAAETTAHEVTRPKSD